MQFGTRSRTIRTMRELPIARQSASVRLFKTPTMIRLLGRELLQASQMLASLHGANALHVRPDMGAPAMSSALPVYQQVRLHRRGNLLAGDVIAWDAALPFASESFSLVLLQHVIETAAEPGGMLDEAIRVLSPEGNLVLIGFKPFAPMRLRWRRAGLRTLRAASVARMLAARNLEVRKVCEIGSVWNVSDEVPLDTGTPVSRLASSWLLIARKRVPGVTPLPTGNVHIAWSAGRVGAV